jgi:hypothetical protein
MLSSLSSLSLSGGSIVQYEDETLVDVKKIYAKKDSGGYVFKPLFAKKGNCGSKDDDGEEEGREGKDKDKGKGEGKGKDKDDVEKEEDEEEEEDEDDDEKDDEFDSGSDLSVDVLSYVQEDISPSNCWTVLKHANAGKKARTLI